MQFINFNSLCVTINKNISQFLLEFNLIFLFHWNVPQQLEEEEEKKTTYEHYELSRTTEQSPRYSMWNNIYNSSVFNLCLIVYSFIIVSLLFSYSLRMRLKFSCFVDDSSRFVPFSLHCSSVQLKFLIGIQCMIHWIISDVLVGLLLLSYLNCQYAGSLFTNKQMYVILYYRPLTHSSFLLVFVHKQRKRYEMNCKYKIEIK